MPLRVLAIDDSRTMRGLIGQALETAGMQVALAEDGEDGLRQLEAAVPDVVVTDLNMPNLDGFGFIAAVRSETRYRGLPILILTTETAGDLRQQARQIGATGWIVKPFDDQRLVATIRKVAIR